MSEESKNETEKNEAGRDEKRDGFDEARRAEAEDEKAKALNDAGANTDEKSEQEAGVTEERKPVYGVDAGARPAEHFKSDTDASALGIVIHITPLSEDGKNYLRDWTDGYRSDLAAKHGQDVADALTAMVERLKSESSDG